MAASKTGTPSSQPTNWPPSSAVDSFGVLMGLLIVAVTAAAYIPAIRSGYIWDDDKYLTSNKLIRDAGGLSRIWTDPQASPQYYPLVFTSYWIEHRLWGDKPLGYHLVNVLLHAANALLVWRLLARLAVPGALAAGLLFALHPVHVESVAWITERKNVLSGFFYLSAMWAYLRFAVGSGAPPTQSGKRAYFLALALFVCALLSKSVTASLPAAILLIIWWKQGRLMARDALPLVPFFVVGLLAAAHTAWLEEHHVGASKVNWGLSAVDRCLVAGRVAWFYFAKLIWPNPLNFFYPHWKIDAGAAWQYLFPLGAIAVVWLLWRFRNRIGRGPLVACLYFGGTLFPVLGFAKVYPMIFSYVADHFQYLASIGAIALLAALASRALSGAPVESPASLRWCVAFSIVTLLGFLTWKRAGAYRDEETLWRDTIAQNPSAWAAFNNLGAHMRDQGRNDEAFECYRKAVEIYPTYVVSSDNYGMMLLERNRPDEAFAIFKRAVESDPYYPSTQRNYGRMLCERGQFDEGVRHLTAATLLDPDAFESHEDLGNALFKQGRVEQALGEYLRVLNLKPDYALGLANLAAALAAIGRADEAVQHLTHSLKLEPNLAVAHCTLGTILTSQGRHEVAAAHFRQAIEIQPVYPQAHANLAIVLAGQGHADQAIEHFQTAVRQAPDNADFHFNLARNLEGQGRHDEAAREYREVLRINPGDEEARKNLAAEQAKAHPP